MPDRQMTHTARLEEDVPAAERRIDDALIAVSSLMTSAVTARRDTDGVPATRGHAAIRRIAKVQNALIDASGDVMRIHGELVEIGRETAGYDLHKCPNSARSNVVPLSSAA
ncbi:hypothetical protein [Sphingopyxis sp. R3-92]|uniref:hypothetical protein n=1 Tax=Sphingopyxis sp. R3-92 TaxID=3158553 RepID=UPI003EE55AFC